MVTVMHVISNQARKMDVEKAEYLPDLLNDKTGEELVFEQRVFHNNEVFKRIHQDIINWHLSDENNCFIPKLQGTTKMPKKQNVEITYMTK